MGEPTLATAVEGARCRAREGSRKPGSEGAACETLGNTIFALTANLPSLNLGLEAPLVQCSGDPRGFASARGPRAEV